MLQDFRSGEFILGVVQLSDYVVCWIGAIAKHWEVISGYDAMQERVNELVEKGVKEDDIVVGEITKDTE